MEKWLLPEWEKMFVLTMSPVELVLRGVLIYVSVCLLFRLILRRQTGRSTLQDMLVVVLVAGVCRNPLVADAYSIPDGLVVVCTILGASFVVDWLSYHYRWIHGLFHTSQVPLIRDGQVLKENLCRELMTEERLCSQLRAHGLERPSEVKEAYLEGTGNVSVIPRQEGMNGEGESSPRNGQSERKPNAPPRSDREMDRACLAEVHRLEEGNTVATEEHSNSPEEGDVRQFLSATGKLRERIHWHEEQMALHHARIDELKTLLAENGVRLKSLYKSGQKSEKPTTSKS